MDLVYLLHDCLLTFIQCDVALYCCGNKNALVLEFRISQVILCHTTKHLLNNFHNTDTGNQSDGTHLDTLQIAVVAPHARIYLWYS